MQYKYPGLVALHDLIVDEKTRKDVLIFGCTNHPTDYSDKELCNCTQTSKAHLIESRRRNLNCGFQKNNSRRSNHQLNQTIAKDKYLNENTQSLQNYFTQNLNLDKSIKENKTLGNTFFSKLPKCSKILNKYECYGTQKFKNFTYVGEFKNKKRHGKGTMTWQNGDKYIGNFAYNLKEGKGSYIWRNGDKYEGNYKNNKMHGKGSLTWVDGDKYVGKFSKGQRSGFGNYFWANGSKYIGEFKNGKRNGEGKYTNKNGNIKNGVWKNNIYQSALKTSDSKKIFKKSSLSSSQIKDKTLSNLSNCPSTGSKFNCFGKIITEKYKYVGEFKNNMKHGKGKYEHIANDKFNGYTYEGEFINDKRHGYGVAKWVSGDNYSGQYVKGIPNGYGVYKFNNGDRYEGEYRNGKRHGEGIFFYTNGIRDEGIWKADKFQIAKKVVNTNKLIAGSVKPKVSYDDLYASRRDAERERKKRIEVERKLASLLAEQKKERDKIDTDIRVPILEIISNKTRGKRGTIRGVAKDNVEVAEVTVDGKPVNISSNGNFEYSTYVPSRGVELKVEVTDVAGLTTSKVVSLKGNLELARATISFDRLNPLSKKVKSNPNALALIVGVSNYENTKARALYADNDAMVFKDYATEKLGISKSRIKVLLNNKADEKDILLSVKEWLRRSAKPNQSDVYIFFAGHGLASDDGKDMYLLPYDGSPRLLKKTAILRDELFSDIKDANPKSVTVFLDTCYSGITRSEDMLVVSRPITIKAKEQAIPNGFTLFSAASNEQMSRPLEEAKHGMFSYFLMKGMEGDADANNDNKITAQELHNYVKENVTQQSSGSQTPELQGDKDRVLVQFN